MGGLTYISTTIEQWSLWNDFYYSPCDKYALRDLLISQREQVSGRKQYGRFDLYIDYDRAVELVEYFYTKYGKDDITCYMLQNITDC